MKLWNQLKFPFGLLLLLLACRQCASQSGYNYGRPNVAVGGSGAATSANPNADNALRPLVGGFSAGPTAAAVFPTAATTFGVAPTSAAYSPFAAGQAQRTGGAAGFVPNVAAVPTGVSGYAGTAGGLPTRPTLPQRTGAGAGIYTGAAQPQYAGTARGAAGATGISSSGADEEGDYSAIPGVPGVDYPIYSQVPQTNFDCAQQPLPGYYSDVEALCQVFHICALNRTYSFLCPNGTVFSQETLVCVWWNQYDCASAPSLYANNAFIYDYGAAGLPSNTGLQSGLSGGRVQQNFAAANAARTPAAATGGIFGAGNVRGAVTGSGNFAGVGVAPTAGFASGTNPNALPAGRYTPAIGAQQGFATGAGVATPAPIGAVIRGAVGVSDGNAVAAGVGAGARAAYPTAQISASATNREYLPPGRRTQ